jgi:uncharacterized protein
LLTGLGCSSDRAKGWSEIALLGTLLTGFWTDRRRYSVQVAAQRVLRKSRIIGKGGARLALSQSPAFGAHVATDPDRDALFYLSHRDYLAKGLTPAQRTQAAVCHYSHEDRTFDASYARHVYGNGALILWQRTVAGVSYDIRLMPGNDVLIEGGLSVVLHVDGGRVCVLSYSIVPTATLIRRPAPGMPAQIIFATRKQMTPVRDYQNAFNAAFDRCTPAHLCFGALSGIALAQGQRFVFGIAPQVHPVWAPERAAQFDTAYRDFWLSLSGRQLSPLGYLIDLPMRLTPVDALDPPRRKRALARRAHIDAVVTSSQSIVANHLHNPAAR